jgi:cellulose synthase/poly-beta-1,6-N-acetylglucosamine synthase-like glycosyltransferase
MVSNVASLVLVAASLVQIGLYWLVYRRILGQKDLGPSLPLEYPPLSILICAKNEAANLHKNLGHILQQDYPMFEVLVVNHASTDETAQVLAELEALYPHLRVLHIGESDGQRRGKKYAIHEGLFAIQHELVLLTDADCWPNTSQWARQMVDSQLCNKSELVLGFSPYAEQPGLLNAWIRYEALFTAMQYLGWAAVGYPYMGVGRNLLYKSSVYKEHCNTLAGQGIASGDDDLLVNKVAKASNTSIRFDYPTQVNSSAPESLSVYIAQKKRHISAGSYYKWPDKVRISLQSLSQLVFIAALFLVPFSVFNLTVIAFKSITCVFVTFLIAHRLNVKLSLVKLLLFDYLLSIYYVLLSPYLLFTTKKWI